MNINKIVLSKRKYEKTYIEITYSDKENIKLEDLLSLQINDNQTHYFEVVKIEVKDKYGLQITAEEAGYWVNNMSLDPRTIIDKQVFLVKDTEEISKVKRESCYL